MRKIYWTILDIKTLTWRNLLRYRRIPQLVIFSTIQPVMFLLLFAYVFGGAIQIPGVDYINYLIPAILVQSAIFGAIQTGVGLAEDANRGLIERFKSLPMSRSAVLAGRTISDALRNVFVVALMLVVGYFMGFRFEEGALSGLAAFGLVILFGFAFSWIAAAIGLAVKNPETAQVAGFIWVFPLVFASSAFVPIETMPAGLEAFARINPVTVTINSIRALTLGGDLAQPLAESLTWILIIFTFAVPLAIYLYKRT